jgi:hypothetical protein
MADFALWGEAVGRGLGWKPGEFTSVYGANRFEASATALESSPISSLLLERARRVLDLECTPTQLYEQLTERAGRKVARSARWPKTTRNFANELRRLAPNCACMDSPSFLAETGAAPFSESSVPVFSLIPVNWETEAVRTLLVPEESRFRIFQLSTLSPCDCHS